MPRPVIALLTDFGTDDPFVGIMKGVILTRCPEASIVDLAHGVAPQRVAEGAFWLERSFRFFPADTVTVAVVDPGVGSRRRAIALRADERIFIGPDNGLLGPVRASTSDAEVRTIDATKLGLPVASHTFHGRDVFAPVAAEIAAGRLAFSEVGAPCDGMIELAAPHLAISPERAEGTVLSVDRFGNLISNLTADVVRRFSDAEIGIGGKRLSMSRTYSDVSAGSLVALIDAFDVLEIACRDGNASRALGLGHGAKVVVRDRSGAR